MSEYQRFLQDKGELLRYDYDLNSDSIVMDVGGYKGEFAENIFKKFECCVCIFEPVFFSLIKASLTDPKIFVHNYGLSNKTEKRRISISADSTSLHRAFNNFCDAQFVDIFELMQSEYQDIDLIKINIEGEEYNLLERMIETGIVNKFVNIQVQFHNFVPDAEKRKTKIQMELLKTHEIVWRYDYIWESWRLKCV